jgi:type IX secretion system PorP/SprF family membrane protein
MKKLFSTLIGITIVLGVSAQQDPQFTQFMADRLSINPAFAGSKDAICGTLMYRNQWAGFDGAPTTILFNGHAPIKSINSGIGLTYFNDNIGQLNTNILRAHYAYHLKVGQNFLNAGVSVGMYNSAIGNEWIAIDGVEDDAAIPLIGQSNTKFDASFGLYFHRPGKFYAGLSSTHLSQGQLEDVNIEIARHYYLMGGYIFDLNPSFNLNPNVLIKSDIASTQYDVNLNAEYTTGNNMIWLGVTYRTVDAIAPQLGYQTQFGKNVLRVGYSYDITTSQISNYSNGSHEIMVNFCFKIEKPLSKEIHKTVRFL